jgi:hypothetical protein
MRIFAVHFYLAENGEPSIEVFQNELLDVFLTFIFLVEKLVAGECQNFQSLTVKLVVHLDHTLVVGRS